MSIATLCFNKLFPLCSRESLYLKMHLIRNVPLSPLHQSFTKDIKSTSFDCCRKGVASFNGRGHWPKRFFFSKNVYVNNSVSVRISLKVWYTNCSVSPKPSFVWFKKKKKVYTFSAYLQLPAVQTPLSSPISFRALPVNSELHMTAVANQRLQQSHDVTSRAVIAEASDWLPFWEGGDRRQLQRWSGGK